MLTTSKYYFDITILFDLIFIILVSEFQQLHITLCNWLKNVSELCLRTVAICGNPQSSMPNQLKPDLQHLKTTVLQLKRLPMVLNRKQSILPFFRYFIKKDTMFYLYWYLLFINELLFLSLAYSNWLTDVLRSFSWVRFNWRRPKTAEIKRGRPAKDGGGVLRYCWVVAGYVWSHKDSLWYLKCFDLFQLCFTPHYFYSAFRNNNRYDYYVGVW